MNFSKSSCFIWLLLHPLLLNAWMGVEDEESAVILEGKNCQILQIGRDLQSNLLLKNRSALNSDQVVQGIGWDLKTSKDEDCTTSLSNTCLILITFIVKRFFLLFSLMTTFYYVQQ